MAVDVAQLLSFTVKNNASDLHLSGGVPPMIRVDGDIKRINMPALTHKDVNSMIYDIMNDKQRKDYEEFFETDFSFEIPKLARFRVNAFNQNRGSAAVFRTIPSEILTLDDLGAPSIFKDVSMHPRGIVLVTGPTGSGKSTTLAAMVDYINENKPDHILTIEDPIEFVHESKKSLINQREVHRDTLGFNEALRSALREDPDIILVGEIRDEDTAEMAFRAAMTGHQVYSTLHTNSAIGALPRLRDIGIISEIMAGNIIGVIAQRLVRKLCKYCKEAYQPDEHELILMGIKQEELTHKVYRAKGCKACDNTGYKGRLALLEILKMNSELDDMLVHGATAKELKEAAYEQGFLTLADDGIRRVLDGITSLEEITRVTDLTERMT